MSRLTRIFLAVALCGLMALVSHSQAHAATLTPPPPAGATCQTTGTGVFCHGDFTFSFANFDIFPCGSFDVLFTATSTVTYEEHYNSAGLGLEAAFHYQVFGMFINSVTGNSVTSNAHYTVTADLATPGDLSTQTTTLTGALNISTGQGFGLVTHDVGKIVFDPTGTILFEGGPHNQIDNVLGFFQAVCTALS